MFIQIKKFSILKNNISYVSYISRKFYSNNTGGDLNNFDDKLFELDNLMDLQNFYHNNKTIVNTHPDKKILFLDYYSTRANQLLNISHDNFNKQFLKEIISDIKIEELKSLDNLYVLSLMESLSNLDYYPNMNAEDSKLWISLEYLLQGTNFIKNVSIENYGIILKAFQQFFMINDSTISPEEIYESIEYQLILKLRNEDDNLKDIIKMNLFKLIEIYVLFAKNLEGSLELYNLFITKILTKENLKLIDYNNLVELYFSSIIVYVNVCPKSKVINNFLKDLDEILIKDNKIRKNEMTLENEDILKWCFNQRNIETKLKFNF